MKEVSYFLLSGNKEKENKLYRQSLKLQKIINSPNRVLRGGRKSVTELPGSTSKTGVDGDDKFFFNKAGTQTYLLKPPVSNTSNKISFKNSDKYIKVKPDTNEKKYPNYSKNQKIDQKLEEPKEIKKSFSVQFNKSYQYGSTFNQKNLEEWISKPNEIQNKDSSIGNSILNSFRINLDESDNIFQNKYTNARYY